MSNYTLVEKGPKFTLLVKGGRGPKGDDGVGLSPIPNNTMLGNISGSSATPDDMTPAEIRDLISSYTRAEVDTIASVLSSAIGTKQNTLVSGTSIKTINGDSLLGAGNILTVTDGDKGDIVVSSSGATWEVDAAAVRPKIHVSKSSAPTLWVWDNGDGEIYVRMPFNASLDLVCNMRRNATTNNPGFIFDELGTVSNTSDYGGTPTITSIASFLDETMGYLTAGNGRAGGAHSLEIVAVTKAGHGLTTADIGKRFQGSDSRLYVITNIVSSSVFWMVQQPITLIGDSGFTRYLPAAASTLTALDGQGNQTGWTAAITTSDVGPTACADLRQEFLIDGEPLIPGRLVNGSRLDVIEYTRVPNLRAAYDYFVATGPTARWTDEALGSMWTRTVQYTWFPWCQLTIEDNARLLVSGLRMNDAGNTQYNPLLGLAGSQNLHVLIPGADSVTFAPAINGVSNSTVVGNEPFYLGSVASDITWGNSLSNQSLVADTKPDHVVSYAAPTTSNISGWTCAHLHAFDPTFGDTTPAARLTHTHEWLRIAGPSRKFYPMNFSWDSALAQFRTFKMRSHRRWTPPVTGIDFWTFVKSDDAWLVYINWQTSPGTATITLPTYLAGLTATAVREFRGALVSSNTANSELQITTSANHGHLIVRLV